MKQAILQASNLSKSYNQLQVLNNVSIDIAQGSFVTIMGASGAGKSTLLHMMGTLDNPDGGTVLFENTNPFSLDKKQQAAFRNQKMGFVFQFHHLLPEFSALENVCMPMWIAGKSKKEARESATALLKKVGLDGRMDHKPAQLSGGEQQRVAIARAIAMRPAILFADEPTGNLDTENANAIHNLFLELKKELGLTLVVVTHNDALAEIADRVVMMKDGCIVKDTISKSTNEHYTTNV